MGVALAGATLVPASHPFWRPTLPPPGYALLVLLVVGLAAAMLARLGVVRWSLALVLATALGGIALGQALHPEYAAPYLRALVTVALLLAALLLVLRPLVRRLFASGGVPLAARQEQALLGIVLFGAAIHFFTSLLIDQTRSILTGTSVAPPNADDARGCEPIYVALRFFAFPFLLYAIAALIAGVRLALARHALGWTILAMLATAIFFGGVHLTVGVWVRYFVFVSPALAIGTDLGTAWALQRGRIGKVAATIALAYGTTAARSFWLAITIVGSIRRIRR